jgi:hypothetical protein
VAGSGVVVVGLTGGTTIGGGDTGGTTTGGEGGGEKGGGETGGTTITGGGDTGGTTTTVGGGGETGGKNASTVGHRTVNGIAVSVTVGRIFFHCFLRRAGIVLSSSIWHPNPHAPFRDRSGPCRFRRRELDVRRLPRMREHSARTCNGSVNSFGFAGWMASTFRPGGWDREGPSGESGRAGCRDSRWDSADVGKMGGSESETEFWKRWVRCMRAAASKTELEKNGPDLLRGRVGVCQEDHITCAALY